ncbi:MAG: SUMF1/EgtB/PvdO family nonheme iron enzyme [Pyrinomonadaceae bacterium]|nr:SUMF1/EgtB/PvdO family nonheme iron enzyme [Pyrinomonadaceae bacterium]
MERSPENFTKKQKLNDHRILPLSIAGLVCFIIAVSGGTIGWYLFGSNSPYRKRDTVATASPSPSTPLETGKPEEFVVTPPQTVEQKNVAPEPVPTPEPTPIATPEAEKILAPAGELTVQSGEITLGGGETNRPLRREIVGSFAIAETEVTNAQFREYIEAMKNSGDPVKNITVPTDKDDFPVTNVNLNDANRYCDWLGRKIGFEVRLPTEAEWELAARGTEGFKYPWGNEWRDNAAANKENKGSVKSVKSFPLNKSPFGAFDMAGNVWEWTTDESLDGLGKSQKYDGPNKLFKNETLYIIKGGAALESKKDISAQARIAVPKSTRLPIFGFRYVVLRDKPLKTNAAL